MQYPKDIEDNSDYTIEFILTTKELKKIICDNFDKESKIHEYFESIVKENNLNNDDLDNFLDILYDRDFNSYQKLISVFSAYYEYINNKNINLIN